MSVWAVVVAAGGGRRFGAAKQFADLAGRPVVDWSLDVARSVCDGTVLVVPADAPGKYAVLDGASAEGGAGAEGVSTAANGGGGRPAYVIVVGGATRSESVRRGLAAVPQGADVIVVHDAARPLAPIGLWRAVVSAVEAGADGAIPGAPVSDTVKRIGDGGQLVTLDRSELVAVQTPQAFVASVLRRVHAGGDDATDDAALVEAAGGRVELVQTTSENLKITSPIDLVVAAALIGAHGAVAR